MGYQFEGSVTVSVTRSLEDDEEESASPTPQLPCETVGELLPDVPQDEKAKVAGPLEDETTDASEFSLEEGGELRQDKDFGTWMGSAVYKAFCNGYNIMVLVTSQDYNLEYEISFELTSEDVLAVKLVEDELEISAVFPESVD
jgi:hypothetical protein